MKSFVRPVAYVVLLALAVFFFNRYRASDRRDMERSTARALERLNDGISNDVPSVGATNPPTTSTANGAIIADQLPNEGTNSTALSPPVLQSADSKSSAQSVKSTSITQLALFIGCLLIIGLLAAWDLSQYVGGRAGQAVMAENYLPPTDAEYEAAEAAWSKGNHMEALSMMRDYLKRHPNEQHVAIRIAEIYEKDLQNHLAAALELEEVLQHRLPREKWGWTAIHLANLYSGKLNQSDKAMEILHRILRDYSETAAARKARQRLGLPEDAPAPTSEPEADPSSSPAPAQPATDSAALPRGFRAKK